MFALIANIITLFTPSK